MKIYNSAGRLEVVCGSMFSGKTEELIRRLRRAIFGQKIVQIFKHNSDDRYSSVFINSHSGEKLRAIPASSPEMISEYIVKEAEVIGIDEIQFFDNDIILLIDNLVKEGKRVIVAGLDLDFRGVPFGPMPHLMALADDVLKLKAVCVKTGNDAHFSQRIVNGMPANHDDSVFMVGASECYEARSRGHFDIDRVPLKEYVERIKN